mmetsp:Transcript_173274/g.421459  ORF Transcript_173274/g.421459 Transcript_173274/m.421459 type:complete len:249 (+) Transcript_173274:566-1312(+)
MVHICENIEDVASTEVDDFTSAPVRSFGNLLREADLESDIRTRAEGVATSISREVRSNSRTLDSWTRRQVRPAMNWMEVFDLSDVSTIDGQPCDCTTVPLDETYSLWNCGGYLRLGGIDVSVTCDMASTISTFPIQSLNAGAFTNDFKVDATDVPTDIAPSNFQDVLEKLRVNAEYHVAPTTASHPFVDANFERYFESCDPNTCTYNKPTSAVMVLTTAIGLLGGLVVVLRTIANVSIDFFFRKELSS